jgi:phage terminase large subunit-like protein
MGRGGGKDGYIAFEAWSLIGAFNGIDRYNVDICANNEDQAKAPFDDIRNILETPNITVKLKKHFYWNKEEIISKKTKSTVRFRTNNPKGKDGLRSGIVIFNEIHQYQDYANINVFTTGLGKKKHPRRTYASTNGDVRDGLLDLMLNDAKDILNGVVPDNGMLPFICCLDFKEEVDDPDNWQKANPSLPYLPNLMEQIRKEYEDWKKHPNEFTAFMTKRMNFPQSESEVAAVPWELILSATKDIPVLVGCSGVAGIDFVKTTDFATAGILTKKGGYYYWISHTWVCSKSLDLYRIKAPYKLWCEQGFLTIVDDVEISPDLIADWLEGKNRELNIEMLAMDNFRFALMKRALERVGFESSGDKKNIKLVRGSDIIKVVPVIDSIFAREKIAWGDNPLMRWFTNNTKKTPASAAEKRISGPDEHGNFKYGKIEPKSRKTDGFMALVAAMTLESELVDPDDIPQTIDLPCYTF